MLTLKEACQQVKEFKTLADILQAEMEKRAFRMGSDFELLNIQYKYLNELVTIIQNETLETTKENTND